MIRFLFLILALTSCEQAMAMSADLRRIVGNIAVSSAHGEHPVVISDLDETLVDSIPRRFQSFRDSVAIFCGEDRQGECGKMAGINIGEFLSLPNRYQQSTFLKSIGIKNETADLVQKDMLKIYSQGTYLSQDQAIPGATEFVQELQEAGATIFFVSSRSKKMQFQGTVSSLENLGFIDSSQQRNVILRPEGMTSIEFKRSSFAKIQAWADQNHSRVELVMENEPENMNAMTEQFPAADGVFVDGAFIKDEPVEGHPLHIRNYR